MNTPTTIKIPEVPNLPTTRAAEVLEGQAEMYRAHPISPWVEPVENLLRRNTVLNGVRETLNGRLNYKLSDVYPVGAGHAVDLEMYRPDGQDGVESTDIVIEGVNGLVELVSGRAKALFDGVEVDMAPNTSIASASSSFIVKLNGPSVTLRVGVNY